MKRKIYKEVKHIFHMNGEEKNELNEFMKQYFDVEDIKDIHIYCCEGSEAIEADITCIEL